MKIGVAIDLGTSGFRAQKINLENNQILKTVVTMRNPLPGANVMDHMDFAINYGLEKAHMLVINAIHTIIKELNINDLELQKLSVCGNPIQLSIFQGIPIDDLAYAGENKKEKLHIVDQKRESAVLQSKEISGLEKYKNCIVIIPPSIKHEIGADALALIINSGMLTSNECSIATDYGTNAEMALYSNGTIYTGSAAAGPALEGQEISCGMLAAPYAISDVDFEGENIRCYILNENFDVIKGDLINPNNGNIIEKGEIRAKGITGTGVISLLQKSIDSKLVTLPKINTPDNVIHLQDNIIFTEKDIKEAGNAIGALRAGHLALCNAAGISVSDIKVSHMSGAAGTYMDALKAYKIGMNPYNVDEITQIGNTSLKMAREILTDDNRLKELQEVANKIIGTHVMFAIDDTFKEVYILELAYWGEGMSLKMFKKFLKKKSLPEFDVPNKCPKINKVVKRDIPEFGPEGYHMIKKTGTYLTTVINNDNYNIKELIKNCPTHAMTYDNSNLKIRSDLCNGSNCKKCHQFLPKEIFSWDNLTII